MTAQVADVTDLDRQVVARLPLNIERVIDGVGQFVGTVVSGKGEKLRAIDDCRLRSAGTDRCLPDCRWERDREVSPRDWRASRQCDSQR